MSFNYVTPILTGEGNGQENESPIEESKDSNKDARKDNTGIPAEQ